jgi:DNA-binding CsgD family transcriptional regulator
MRQTYGLTPAEIRVAEMLAECLTVDETAERLGISRSTVKAHQQNIYEKTNTNSRAKLMKLLMSLAQ